MGWGAWLRLIGGDAREGSGFAAAAEDPEVDGGGEGHPDKVGAEGEGQEAGVEGAVAEDGAHAFEDGGAGEQPAEGLGPAGQAADGVVDGGDWLDEEGDGPGEGFGGLPPAHDEGRREEAEGPAEEHEEAEEGNEMPVKLQDVEVEGGGGEESEDADGDEDAEDADDEGCGDVFDGADGGDEEIDEVFGPDVFEEGDGDGLLGAEEDVPKDHPADEPGEEGGDGSSAFGIFKPDGKIAPDHQFHDGPEEEFDEPDGVAAVEVEVAPHERMNDGEGHERGAIPGARRGKR